jgi:hypothetical protein
MAHCPVAPKREFEVALCSRGGALFAPKGQNNIAQGNALVFSSEPMNRALKGQNTLRLRGL